MEKHPFQFENMNQVIDFAIEREREAQEIYLGYYKTTDRIGFRQLLLSMAEMEKEHEKKLTMLKQGIAQNRVFSSGKIIDLKLSDFLVNVEYSPDMDYGDFLIVIIKKENEAEQLYKRLESLAEEREVKQLFWSLADEERKHKAWAQDRYDLEILKEN